MQYIELSPVAAFLLRVNIITAPAGLVNIITAPAGGLLASVGQRGSVMIFTRPAGAVMIFTRSRNAAMGDNSMYCMIPDPIPSSAFGKGSAPPRNKGKGSAMRDYQKQGLAKSTGFL